jgi:hypothetical protein
MIRAPADSILHISFDAFDVEYGENCMYDKLMVNAFYTFPFL